MDIYQWWACIVEGYVSPISGGHVTDGCVSVSACPPMTHSPTLSPTAVQSKGLQSLV